VRLPKQLQLAQLVDEAPAGDEWLHEQKFDGYRILATCAGRKLQLLSRRFNDWTEQFPTVVDAVSALAVKSVMLDGEVCVVMPDGRTSFQALQNAFGRRDANIVYFAFDLLELDGEDIAKLPLEERKRRLAKLLGKKQGVIRYSDHVVGSGDAFFKAACKKGLEGIVSKKRGQPYTPGRGGGWVKTKCLLRQELVIGGYTDPAGSRTEFGALLVGYYERGALRYAGKVGSGYSREVLRNLGGKLARLERPKPPFTGDDLPRRGVHWVEPRLVAQIAYTEVTRDGKLRHPRYVGLRPDKPAADVRLERPAG